jgi:phage/plasmid-like protein (TIGR03299 family)
MAHQIENNMFAYKGQPAWHGLGFQVDADMTGEEMLKVAGMDWQVQRRQLAMRNQFGDKSIMLTSQLDEFRAITRADNNEVFQIASKGYTCVQNLEIVNFFKDYCEAGHASIETVGGLRGGAVVWALARLESGESVIGNDTRVGMADVVSPYLLLTTSHDGSLKTTGKPTSTRVVCHNTLTAALARGGDVTAQFSMKHTRKFGDADKAEARRVMKMAVENTDYLNEVANDLARVTIDHDGWMEFIGKLVGEDNLLDKDANLAKVPLAIQEATMSSPGSNLASARGTLWGAVNGVTYYVDHVARARSESNRLFSSWFGSGESMKNTAVRIAREMAGVS